MRLNGGVSGKLRVFGAWVCLVSAEWFPLVKMPRPDFVVQSNQATEYSKLSLSRLSVQNSLRFLNGMVSESIQGPVTFFS